MSTENLRSFYSRRGSSNLIIETSLLKLKIPQQGDYAPYTDYLVARYDR